MSTTPITVCLTCLSTTRKVYPIENANFFASLTLLKLSDSSKFRLCWECYATVRRAKLFRDKALKAHAILTGQSIPTNVPLSTLCHKELKDIIYIEHYPPINACEVYVKDEPLSLNIEYEYCENETSVKAEETYIDTCPSGVIDEKSSTNQGNEQELGLSQESKPHDVLANEKTLYKILKIESIENTKPKLITSPNPKPHNTAHTLPNSSPTAKEPLPSNPVKHENNTVETIKQESESQEDSEINQNYTLKMLSEEELVESRKKRLQEIKEKNGKFICEMCVEAFSNGMGLASHMNLHKALSGAFACRICEIRFETETLMRAHTETHYRMYACNKCNEVFSSLFEFTSHYNIHPQPYFTKCDQCDAKFRTKHKMLRHKRMHQERVECPVCKKRVKSYSLYYHLLIHKRHPKVECDICHKTYEGKHRLESHKRSMHKQKDDEGAFCVECDVRFKSAVIYKMHLKNSTKHARQEELQQCPHCERKFSCKTYLNGHIQRVHVNTSGFTCDQCVCTSQSQSFVSKQALRRHVLKVHEKRVAPRDKICDICGKGFQLAIHLRQHMNGHLNIRPYKCEHCGDSFTNKGAKYNHIKLKHKKTKSKKPDGSVTDSCG